MRSNKKVIGKALMLPALIGVFGLAMVLTASPMASAQLMEGINAAGSGDGMQQNVDENAIVQNIVNIFLYIVGVVAVIMIIFSGFQYLTSAGDATKAKKAQTTLLYSIVGLVVAIFAYAIVNFVITRIAGGGGAP